MELTETPGNNTGCENEGNGNMHLSFCKAAITTLSDSLALMLVFLVILKLFPSIDASLNISFKSSLAMGLFAPRCGTQLLRKCFTSTGRPRDG